MSRLSAAGWASIPGALLALALLFAAHAAHARTETLRWEYSEPSLVDGFRAHVGSSSRSYDQTIDLGLPTADGSGVFSRSVQVSDGATVYVAVTAYTNGGQQSPYSNELRFVADTSGDDSTSDGSSDDSGSGDGSGSDGSGSDGSDGTDGSGDTGGTDGSSGGGSAGSGPTVASDRSLYYEDFEAHATGTAIPSWLDTGADNSLQENDALFAVRDAGGSRVLSTSSTATNVHSHYVGGQSADWSGYELRGRLRIDDASGGIGVTTYSQYDAADVYYRLRRYKSNGFHIAPHPHQECPSGSTGVVPEPDTWYRYRLRVEAGSEGTRVLAKVWTAGGAEPSGWQAECLDSGTSRPGSGTIGAWSMGPGAKYWDDVEVVDLSTSTSPGGDSGGSDGDETLSPPGRPVLITP